MEDKIPAALFDFDGTLARGDSLLPFLLFVFRRHPRALVELPGLLFLLLPYGLGLISKERMKTAALKVLRHVSANRLPTLLGEFHDEVLIQRLLPAGIERVRWHKEQGHTLVLASASVDLYLEYVSRHLGFDTLVCTRTVLDPLPAIVGANCYGKEKVARLANLGLFQCTDWKASWAYSDHISDLPMFLLCGNPVAVNPSRPLRRHARREGWEIVDWCSIGTTG